MCISHVWRASSRSDIKAGEVDFQCFSGVPKMALGGPQTGVLGHLFGGSRGGDTQRVKIEPLRHQSRRAEFSVFFRGAGNGPERASNERFGSPFWRLKGGTHKGLKWSRSGILQPPYFIERTFLKPLFLSIRRPGK